MVESAVTRYDVSDIRSAYGDASARPFTQILREACTGYFETRGNLSFSDWSYVLNEKTKMTELIPGHIQYVVNGPIRGGESIWFMIEKQATKDVRIDVCKSINYSKRTEEHAIGISNGIARTLDGSPSSWAENAVNDDVLRWLRPLVESGFKKPIITRDDEGRLVFVDRAGYHVYYSKDCIDGNLSYINVVKGNERKDSDIQLQFDEWPHREVLYFNHSGLRTGVEFDFGGIAKKAWGRPENQENGRYEDVELGRVEDAASKTRDELLDALHTANSIARHAAINGAFGKLLRKDKERT
ncbi:Uncharacterised protein [uncultured archaeon]|nr:Uncharacterised protein [uncultured archaeon]